MFVAETAVAEGRSRRMDTCDWRPDVPMPGSVAMLPRNDIGIPIGYTTLWASEWPVAVRPEPLLDGTPAIFHLGGVGEGEAIINMANAERTRRSVLLGLCQVCGTLLDGAKWIADLRIDRQTLRIDDEYVPLIVDSWSCEPCLRYSLLTCPGLARRQPFDVLRVTGWLPVPTPERPKYLTAEMLPYGPIGFVKVAVTACERASWLDWLDS